MKTKEKWIAVHPKNCAPVKIGTYSLQMIDARNEDPDVLVNMPGFNNRPNDKSIAVCIEATFDCTMRCKYCFMNEDETYLARSGNMDIRTVIDYLRRFAPADKYELISISYMGGEPTMNMDLLVRVRDYVRKTYKRSTFGLTTNATRFGVKMKDATTLNLNPKLTDLTIGQWLAVSGHSITLSLDGPKEVHDSQRVFCNGTGTFDVIMDGLRALKETHPQFVANIGFRATLTDGFDTCSVKERLQFFHALSKEGIGHGVHFESNSKPGGDRADLLSIMEDQYYEAADWVIERAKAGDFVSWRDVTVRPLRRLLTRKPICYSCGAGCGYLTLGIDGEVYACHRTNGAQIGSMKEGFNSEQLAKWGDRTVMYQIPCSSCALRYLCGANCRAANLSETGDLRTVSENSCGMKMIRMMVAVKMMLSLHKDELLKLCEIKEGKPNETNC